MTPDEERWAEALAIIKWKGDAAEAYVIERLVALHSAADRQGMQRFGLIADRIRQLREGSIH